MSDDLVSPEVVRIVTWLRESSAAVRQHHADVCMTEDDDILDAIVTRMETFAFVADQIEQGMYK